MNTYRYTMSIISGCREQLTHICDHNPYHQLRLTYYSRIRGWSSKDMVHNYYVTLVT